MHVKGLMRLVQTTRHLRFKQVSYRIYYRVRGSSRFARRMVPESLLIRAWEQPWAAPRVFDSPLDASGHFSFLGESAVVAHASDWNDPERSKLWLYNLHYFDVLNSNCSEEQARSFQALIDLWIEHNPPMHGNGWEPYPLSLRLVNWVNWFSRHSTPIPKACLASMALQVQALLRQLEYHILGNHLFANGKALVFAGAFFDGVQAASWLRKGLSILDREVAEQFLADGAHFELSPMYHATLLWDLCDLVHLAQCSGIAALRSREQVWRMRIEKGLAWLSAMLHPDKKISFFNDATFGIAPEFSDLVDYARQLGIVPVPSHQVGLALEWLRESGYCAVAFGNGTKALMDIACVGPDYQPGHAHADSLSFELSVHHQRVLVNSGISRYGEDAQRHFERSTRAHNTVCINGVNSSDVWAGFRVGRRARPRDVVVDAHDRVVTVAASHDGYNRLAHPLMHRREWRCMERSLQCIDTISGRFTDAVARFYVHPEVVVRLDEGGLVRCRLSDGSDVLIRVLHYGHIALEPSFWYPQFGLQQQNVCLVVDFKGRQLVTEISW